MLTCRLCMGIYHVFFSSPPLCALPLSVHTGAFGRVYKGILTLPGVYTENKLTLKTAVAVKTVKSERPPMCVCVHACTVCTNVEDVPDCNADS